MILLKIVLFYLCVNTSVASLEVYRAGILDNADTHLDANKFVPLIYEAGKAEVDILVLPGSEITGSEDSSDEIVKTLSKATRQAGLYVVAHLHEKTRCQNKLELIRSNLVFNREGNIVSVYRKPLNSVANCTSINSEMTKFTTDFGVTFGLLMEEDLVTQRPDALKNLKNFVVTGAWTSRIPFLSATQFSSSWAYINNANLVFSGGIYSGKDGLMSTGSKLLIADLNKDEALGQSSVPVVDLSVLENFPGEDLSQYIIRPLDETASAQGYKETVCHGRFCCGFYVKATFTDKESDVNYGLAVFDGVRHYGRGHHIGTQNCAVLACAGLYKRTCALGSENNNTNVIFDKITITANFSKHTSVQYPAILTTDVINPDQFNLLVNPVRSGKQVIVDLSDGKNLLNFGIFGRDFSRDFDKEYTEKNTEGLTLDIYEYLYDNNVQEFFDYLWIRIRILLFVVSIYILEMM